MAGIAGAKNTYTAGVRLGNWVEDAWGERHSTRMTGPAPVLGVSETTTRYVAPPPGIAGSTKPVPRPLDSLDGHLVFAHGPDIVERAPPPDHYLTLAQAQMAGAHVGAVLDSKTAVRGRTELLRQKATLLAAGVDSWDPASVTKAGVPPVPSTIAPTPAMPTFGAGLSVPADAAVSAGAFAVLRAAGGGAGAPAPGAPPSAAATARLSASLNASGRLDGTVGVAGAAAGGATRSSSPGAGVVYPRAGGSGVVSVSGVALTNTAALSAIAPPRADGPSYGRKTSFTREFHAGHR